MNRDDVLKRVFSNSGLSEFEEGYPSSTLPAPSELYPYSEAKAPGEPLSMQTMQDVSPGPAEWFGGKTGAGGIALPLPMPANMPLTEPLADEAFNQAFNSGYNSASNAASNADANAKAREQAMREQLAEEAINMNKQPATKPLIKDSPIQKPQIKREEIPQGQSRSLRPQAQAENLLDVNQIYPEAAQIPQQYTIQSSSMTSQPMRQTLDVSKEYPEATEYVEQKPQSIIQSVNMIDERYGRGKTEVASTGRNFTNTDSILKTEKTIEGSASSGKNFAEPAPVRQNFIDYALNYQTSKNESALANPLKAAATEIGSAALAAPAIGAIGALGASAAATPIASNILQFPTPAAQVAQAASKPASNILQFAPRAASAAVAAGAAALPKISAAESTWNPTTQKYTQPVNNKASATKAPAPSASVSTTASDAVKSLSNLANKLNNAIKGLNIGR